MSVVQVVDPECYEFAYHDGVWVASYAMYVLMVYTRRRNQPEPRRGRASEKD